MSNRFLYKFPKFSLILRKRLIALPLFLFSIMVFGKSYYIKNGGNDLLAGTSDSTAWESISKVNSFSFSAGDNIFFKKGDTFIGTLTPASSGTSSSYITFGAYGIGDDPIITPNAVVTGLTWTVHSGSIYKTTGIGYNPGNILINGTTKICKINDRWMTEINSNYGGFTPLELLALAENYTFSKNGQNVYFWDGLDALYCYDATTGTTYLRFRGGGNPNDSTFAIAAENSSAVYIYAKRYIIIQNLQLIGGQYGVDLNQVNYDGNENIIIENCHIESSNGKVYIHNGSKGIVIRNNTMTNNYLSSYTPGAWADGTEYIHGVHRHLYEFGKQRIGTGDSGDADQAVFHAGGPRDNITVHDNIITNCINGIWQSGSNNHAYNNYIEGTSSIAIYFGEGAINASAYDNYIVNSNIPFRFGYVDNTTYPGRTNYVYRNKIYIPDAGELIYIHYGPSRGVSTTQAYFYHNSIICKTGLECSYYAGDHAEGTGFMFVNNIISVSGDNTAGWSGMATQSDLFKFYYNWMGGTYYGAESLPGDISVWATDPSNLNNVGATFWDHSIDPPDFTNISGTEVIDAGIDVSKTFTLGGVNYSALPGIASDDYYGDAPDLGAWEYNSGYPYVAITSPTSGSTFTAPATINITANASDEDGSISRVEFFNGATKLGERTSNPWSFTWNNVPVGTYSLTAVATDNSGAKTTSSAVSITVNNLPPVTNQPPVVTISNPTKGEKYTEPANITINSVASDPDGTISKVEFFNGSIKLFAITTAPYSFTWKDVAAGTYSITAVATDNLNATTTSVPVNVEVEARTIYDVNSEILNIYPNPNDGHFSIYLIEPLQNENSEIIITTLDGQLIYREPLLQEEITKEFDLSYLRPGIYIFILSGSEIIVTKKFIKK